jgi:hypothetical protein
MTLSHAQIQALTNEEIIAVCLKVIRCDPRIVAALDVIEGVSRDIDKADLPGDRCRLALEALGQVEHILTRPVTSEATP